jgi:hypothetical protein
MRRDAQAVGRGAMYVAPPPMIGGDYQRHAFFSDLFDAQTNAIESTAYREGEWRPLTTRRRDRSSNDGVTSTTRGPRRASRSNAS